MPSTSSVALKISKKPFKKNFFDFYKRLEALMDCSKGHRLKNVGGHFEMHSSF